MKKRKSHKKTKRHDDTGSSLPVVPESEEEDLEEDRSSTSQPDSSSNSIADDDDADSLDEVIMIAVQMDEVGASVPAPEEMQMDGKHTRGIVLLNTIVKPLLGRRYVRYTLAFLGFLIVLVLISMAASHNKKQNISVESSSGNALAPPTNTSSSSKRHASVAEIRSFLKSHGVNSTDFLVPGMPQHKVIEWLAETDGANLMIPNTSEHTYHFVARYVLALNYFALDGEQWEQKLNFLSSQHVCQWHGPSHVDGLKSGVLCDENDDGPPLQIRLENNRVRGVFPTEIGLLTSLQVLDLRSNFVENELPTELCQLKNLKTFAFSENALTGTIPSCLANLHHLEYLYVASNLLTGSLPKKLENVTSLQRLVVEDNLLTGNPVHLLQSLTGLEFVFFDDNFFQGQIASNFLVGHSNLRHLDLSRNRFTLEDGKDFPSHLWQMQRLESLDLSYNDLSGHILPDDVTLTPNDKLKFVALNNNTLSGELYSELQQLVALEHLDLSNNQFHGSLRTEFGEAWKNLKYLFLSNNNFDEGTIPTEFRHLTSLVDFSMRNTHRDGRLPKWIGTAFPNLVLLDLGQNNFTGSIPEEFATGLPSLRYLLLNGNGNVDGTIPSVFSNKTSLKSLFLDGTSIYGDLDFMCPSNKQSNFLLFADCHNQSNVHCTCCECCRKSDSGCSDPYLADLDSSLAEFFTRTEYNLSNIDEGKT